MAGRHSRPEARVPPHRWYVWMLLVPPPVTIVFVLAGWWPHYRLVPVIAGSVLAVLSLVLQYRNLNGLKPREPDVTV